MKYLLEKIKKDRVDKAVETLKGYCNKHSDCDERCRLYDKENKVCMLEKGILPCDWSVNND